MDIKVRQYNQEQQSLALEVEMNRVKALLQSRSRAYEKEKEVTTECVICIDEFQSKEKVTQLKCNKMHIFHMDCLLSWIRKNQICPICRQEIELD